MCGFSKCPKKNVTNGGEMSVNPQPRAGVTAPVFDGARTARANGTRSRPLGASSGRDDGPRETTGETPLINGLAILQLHRTSRRAKGAHGENAGGRWRAPGAAAIARAPALRDGVCCSRCLPCPLRRQV